MGFRRIQFSDRMEIQKLLEEGKTVKEVSKITGFHISTIYREIKRGQEAEPSSSNESIQEQAENYSAKNAQLHVGG